ncbi:MAG TPA: class D sortase [Acidimicrobiales bacterium]|nr:class D sortase [Acidimicrobiales bacterium]
MVRSSTRVGRAASAGRRRWPYRGLVLAGVLLVAGAGAWQLDATLWTHHSEVAGKALVHRYQQGVTTTRPTEVVGDPSRVKLGSCGAADTGDVRALLVVPALGLVAPVEEGVGDAQLEVAVGHLPSSVWPGTAGTAVLEAHDVSYFVNLPALKAGDTVLYETPCTTSTFVVESHAVVTQGAPVYNTPGPTLTLVTCWPTNALWFTPQRYVVTLAEASSTSTNGAILTYASGAAAPTVPAPAALASQGLTLTTNSIPMGTLTLAGTPGQTWSQSTAPLLVQSAAVSGFIAGVKALAQDRLDWWSAVAPGVSPPTPLVGAHVPAYLSPLDVTLRAAGDTVTGVTLSTTVTVTGGHAPGRYAVSVTETVTETATGSTVVVAGWTMTRA